MTTRLLLIADTHVPKRAWSLPDAVRRAASGVDLVVHAGDWVTASVLDDLGALAPVLGVWGNNDGAALRTRQRHERRVLGVGSAHAGEPFHQGGAR